MADQVPNILLVAEIPKHATLVLRGLTETTLCDLLSFVGVETELSPYSAPWSQYECAEAFTNFEETWRDAAPWDAEQPGDLDPVPKDRGITLGCDAPDAYRISIPASLRSLPLRSLVTSDFHVDPVDNLCPQLCDFLDVATMLWYVSTAQPECGATLSVSVNNTL